MDEIYQHVSIFKDLDENQLAKLQEIAEKKNFAKGEVIFSEGDLGDIMYIIVEGRVRLTHTVSLGIEKTLLILEAGNLFGEMALMTTNARSASAVAEEDCQLLLFRQEPFFQVLNHHQQLGVTLLHNMMQLLVDRLRITTNGYLQSISWGLEVAGAAALNLDKIIKDQLGIEVTCTGNTIIKGRLLKVEKSVMGLDLIIKDIYGKIIMVPYHAIIMIDVNYEGVTLL